MKLFNAPPLSQFAKPASTPVPAAPQVAQSEAPSDIRILPISRLAQGGRWRVEAMRALSEPCLLWFTRGQGRITIGGVTRGYGPHNAIFIPAGVMHGFETSQQTHGSVLFFGRDHGVTLPHATHHLRIREGARQVELSGILESIQRELVSESPGAERAARHHVGLLGVWLERQLGTAADEAPKPTAAKRLVSRYAALLERDFRTGHGIAEFAAELGVTPTHLTRSCRATCGRAASDLLQDRKMFEARRLLADTRLPVKQISGELGFTSPAYFTRAFHAKTGKTPSQFRRNG